MTQKSTNSSAGVFVYDTAAQHFSDKSYPNALPIEQAHVHIGFFLGWVIDHDMYSNFFEEEFDLQILRFKSRTLTPSLISELWNGKISDELFSAPGNMFAHYYYGSGLYAKDYREMLCGNLPSMYHVADSWENYALMQVKISERYAEWQSRLA